MEIRQAGKAIYDGAAGNVSQGSSKAVTPGLAYPIASISKIFTGVVAVKLHETGVLGLDTPLGEALPGLFGGRSVAMYNITPHEAYKTVTLRSLLSMRCMVHARARAHTHTHTHIPLTYGWLDGGY